MQNDYVRRGNPNWVKGGPSPNPSGRSKGAGAVAAYVADQTDDGRELVDMLLRLMRQPGVGTQQQMAAALALLDRMIGKPVTPSVVQAQVEVGPRLPESWASLPAAERAAWLQSYLPLPLPAGERR
jgi:hypothetical protein